MLHSLTHYVFPTVLLLILIRKLREMRWGKCKNKVKLKGKVAIITGANSGIGLETAKELVRRNAHVILACRSLNKAKEACTLIKTQLKFDSSILVTPMELDLASLSSIKKFADGIKSQYREIHILINNAGVSFPNKQRVKTKDGFEINFGVNHLGHFYLTNQLLEVLSGHYSRVVVISSLLHEKGEINLKDLNGTNISTKTNLYANSKLANVYFAMELAKRTKDRGIHVYVCCPGWVYTNLFRHSIKWYHYFVIAPVAYFFMRSAKMGAQTSIYCATEPSIEKDTGLLYRDCRHYSSRTVFFDKVALKLWEESENMINSVLKKDN